MKETDFCKVCHYYLYLEEMNDEKQEPMLRRICRNCGYEDIMQSGLILEIDLKEKTSEGYKILMNEFTKEDPTLPHVHTIQCPNKSCKCNTDPDKEPDIIYLKYDAINMKFLYICNLCNAQWRSKA